MKVSMIKIITYSVFLMLVMTVPQLHSIGLELLDISLFPMLIFMLIVPVLYLTIKNTSASFSDIKMVNCGISRKEIYKLRIKEVYMITALSTTLIFISFMLQSFFIENNVLLPISNKYISVIVTTFLCSVICFGYVNAYMYFKRATQGKVSFDGIIYLLYAISIMSFCYFRDYMVIVVLSICFVLLILIKRRKKFITNDM